jgi:hypothetical protein
MISPVVSLRPWNKIYQIAQKNEEMLRTDQGVVKLAIGNSCTGKEDMHIK